MDHIAHTQGKWFNAGLAKLFDNGYSKLNDKQIHKMGKNEAIKRVPLLKHTPAWVVNHPWVVQGTRHIADNTVKGMSNEEKAAVMKKRIGDKAQEAAKRLSQTLQKHVDAAKSNITRVKPKGSDWWSR